MCLRGKGARRSADGKVTSKSTDAAHSQSEVDVRIGVYAVPWEILSATTGDLNKLGQLAPELATVLVAPYRSNNGTGQLLAHDGGVPAFG